MVVRELITRLGFQTNKKQLDWTQNTFIDVRKNAEKTASAVRNMFAGLATFATLKAIIRIADEMQNMRSRLSMLPQTVGDVGAAFDEVAKRASASGMAISAYSALYTRVGNAAKDYITTQEDLLGITDTISQALTVGGASAQEASAVMTQFSQALASGVLQGDEFRSMAEAAPQYLDKLSEAMNIPREQLKKMASDGKLTAREVIEATRKMSDYFSDKYKQIPMTVGRATTIIGNRFATMIDKMNRESLFITNIANALLSGFDKIEGGITKLIATFSGTENMFRLIGTAIAVALGAKTLAILSTFSAASILALLPFIKMVAIIGVLTLAIEDLYLYFTGGESVIGDFVKWLNSGARGAYSLKAGLSVLAAVFVALTAKMVITFAVAQAGFAKMLIGITIWAVQMAAAFAVAFWPIAALIGLLGLVLAAVMNFDVIVEFMNKLAGIIYDAVFQPIIDGVTEAWKAVKNLVGDAWQDAKTFVGIGDSQAGNVSPSQVAPSAMGAARPNIQSNTNVTVIVPPGTTAEQAKFLDKAAAKSFGQNSSARFARDIAVYAP